MLAALMSRNRTILSATLLAVAAFVSGLMVGSHWLSQLPSEKPNDSESLSQNLTNNPPSSHRRKTTREPEESEPDKIRSLDEIKAALAEIATRKLADRFNAISDLVASVQPNDLPAVLEFAEKASPEAFRSRL